MIELVIAALIFGAALLLAPKPQPKRILVKAERKRRGLN
ncbi:hypothetical protein C8N36_101295 [Pelagimonas varians]|uniref:Uncharacterized protein n=1 Tax=Pelagimonas varians TaxID=696760 RepID=A0A238JR32_9RHOB|nr:hypothetical protein C8N36_101295 [Pelagimonas varians]SMX33110.1 hypothetical protein PEV8663_00171 [Pelagimonas varians]